MFVFFRGRETFISAVIMAIVCFAYCREQVVAVNETLLRMEALIEKGIGEYRSTFIAY